MSMKLKSIFQKKIDRDIKGVIKAGDGSEADIKQDLEEFVVTEELRKHMDRFFEAYGRGIDGATDKNGVWISGFFGSGKSHLLKILSYALRNEPIEDKKVISYFRNKGLKKNTLDNMKKAEQVSTDVILFNIASKVEQGAHKEAVVKVFNRAFNEIIGLCVSKPWVAAMESQLIKEGVYECFKNTFEEVSGKSWTEGRENFYYHKDSIIKALVNSVKISESSAKEWCENCERDFTLNVESFAIRVKEHCHSKGENHHVVFLVDEIGQYMGNDPKEMLNLQTVVEELALKCKGKCWVIVTSQDELRILTEENTNDFSKIQGRFNTNIALSSDNADEVIKKRLLKKNKKGELFLRNYFEENEMAIKNLIVFPNESGLKGYESSEDFLEIFPFVTYQFQSLKMILNGVRVSGMAGSSLSSGERSLLEAYQRVAVEYMNEEVGNIIPLWNFYDVIETYINPSIKEVIQEVKKNKEIDEFTLNVLKTLFLIKHIGVIEATEENITTLMISNLKACKKSIKKRTIDSLAFLVNEGLVEKSGVTYIFLTKDEQQINREIDRFSPTKEEVDEKIGELIFGNIYKETRFNYSSKYKFSFNRYVDNIIVGTRRSDIGIRIITANFPIYGDEVSELKRLSTIHKDVIIDISKDFRCIEAVEKLLKIDLYLRENHGDESFEGMEILKKRKREARDLLIFELDGLLKNALREAHIYVSGTQLQQGEKNGIDKIGEGLRRLINTEYFKLHYVKDFGNNSDELKKILIEDLINHDSNNSIGQLALEEVRTFIEGAELRGNQVNFSDVLSRFTKIPFGWKDIDVQAVILQLLKYKQIKGIIKEKGIKGDIDTLYEYIIDKKYVTGIFFKPRIKISPKYLEVLEDLGKSLFNIFIDTKDSERAMLEFKDLCKEELSYINHMIYELKNNELYPGRHTLDLGERIFQQVLNIEEESEFYKEIYNIEEDFEDYMDEGDHLKSFYFKRYNGTPRVLEKGDQRIIFDKAVDGLKTYEEDEDFIVPMELRSLMVQIKSIIYNRNPYGFIKDLPELMKRYDEGFTTLINGEAERVKAYCDESKADIENLAYKYNCDEQLKNSILQEYISFELKISSASTLMKLAALEKLIERKSNSFKEQIRK